MGSGNLQKWNRWGPSFILFCMKCSLNPFMEGTKDWLSNLRVQQLSFCGEYSFHHSPMVLCYFLCGNRRQVFISDLIRQLPYWNTVFINTVWNGKLHFKSRFRLWLLEQPDCGFYFYWNTTPDLLYENHCSSSGYRYQIPNLNELQPVDTTRRDLLDKKNYDWLRLQAFHTTSR